MRSDATNRAIELSIEHWERLYQAVLAHDAKRVRAEGWSAEVCPLCQIFIPPYTSDEDPCDGCPVAQRARRRGCVGTPWGEADIYLYSALRNPGDLITWQRAQGAVLEELEFLRSLRDE